MESVVKESKDEENEMMMHCARGKKIESIVKHVIGKKELMETNPCLELFDFDVLHGRLSNLEEAFPEPYFIHACAIKANPIRGILKEIQKRGHGAECASFAETFHALSLDFSPRKIIYDSPCKTMEELRDMIQKGVYINLDNLEEIAKVNSILNELGHLMSLDTKKQFGLRINPVVGGGKIDSTSTATASSKFGIPCTKDTEEELFSLFSVNPWIQGVHVHVGSQGCSLDLLVQGTKRCIEFAELMNARLGTQQIQVIDIGGGLPTDYDSDQEAFSYCDYANALREQVPLLFSGKYTIITEFGRSLLAKAGFSLTRVEAMKTWENQHIAITHLGANQFLRVAYLPSIWHHRFSVFDAQGNLKQTDFLLQDLAGPLCFSGDFLGKQVFLPRIQTGDYIVIHDTGAYTSSMYSKYNTCLASAVYAFQQTAKKQHAATTKEYTLFQLKPRETTEEALRFWGLEQPSLVLD